MAINYQNFTIPIGTNPTSGWAGLNDNLQGMTGGIGEMLAKQSQIPQQLQIAQAQEFAKAQAEAWAKQQDPLAIALHQAQLAQGGNPIGLQGLQSPPSMADMLQGNPYARYLSMPSMFGGQAQPQQQQQVSMPSIGGQSNPTMSFSPFASGNPAISNTQPGNFAQVEHKISPYGTEPERQITDINASNQVAGNKSYAEQIGQAQGKQASATSMLDNITKNLAADLKSHFAEAGGGGPIKGRIAGWSTNFGMSPATTGLKNTIRDSAIAYARDLAGGSQGVQRLFSAIMETIPGPGATQEQAGTALLQMHLTAAQLQAGMSALGLSPQDMSKLTDEQVQNVMSSGNIDRQAETDKFSKIMGDIQPTKVMDMSGKLSNPQINPILGAFGQGQFQSPTQNTQPQSSQLPSRDEIMAELQRRQGK